MARGNPTLVRVHWRQHPDSPISNIRPRRTALPNLQPLRRWRLAVLPGLLLPRLPRHCCTAVASQRRTATGTHAFGLQAHVGGEHSKACAKEMGGGGVALGVRAPCRPTCGRGVHTRLGHAACMPLYWAVTSPVHAAHAYA